MTAVDSKRIRISTFCNVDYHSNCFVNDNQCHCTCHSETWTFEDTDDVKNIITRVSYDLFMANNKDSLFIYSLFHETFEKLGYTVVPDGKDTEDKTISTSKIDTITLICVEINERSKTDGWGSGFPEKLANEWNVLTDIYPPNN